MSQSVRSCGVRLSRTSPTRAAAEAISDTGAATRLSSSPSRQAVRIDSESFPTGMLMPSRRQN